MKKIVKRKRPFLIAEIGINHNGSIKLAKKLIDLAKKYNFDSVKFQKRDSDICVPKHQKDKMRTTPWGDMTYLEYRKKIEFVINQGEKYKSPRLQSGAGGFVMYYCL